MKLRPYQLDLKNKILAAWAAGHRYVMAVSATGTGKTVLFGNIVAEEPSAACVIAHRQELVSQISLALARVGVRHRIIGSESVRRACVSIHMAECGRSFYDPHSKTAVAGVDTLVRMDARDPWFATVTLTVTDEGHHVLEGNKWGKALLMFPNARSLAVTATPSRADGKGLGRGHGGLMDALVLGPQMRLMINEGYLTRYRVLAPPNDVDLSAVPISEGGDYSPVKLRAAVHRSHIVGDVVEHYLKHASGKLGVTFAVDIEHATEICAAYRLAGVPAEVVTSHTPDGLRAEVLRKFRRRETLQLVNVDLFGEGFDLPAIEVVSMARPTMSYGLYVQQFGRALRPLAGKDYAIILDHVGNVLKHNLPDKVREWSLLPREKRSANKADDGLMLRACQDCTSVFERFLVACPVCGWKVEPAGRSVPEQVDGDLTELDEAAIARMLGDVIDIETMPSAPAYLSEQVAGAWYKHQRNAMLNQGALRRTMGLFGGYAQHCGHSDREAQKLFYLTFGVDVIGAQSLRATEAHELQQRIGQWLDKKGVIENE